MANRAVRLGGSVALTMAMYGLAASPLVGQVGYSPDKSPFRDIRKGHTLTAVAGYFGGSGGRFGIGPHNGMVYGGRYDIRTGSTMQFGLSISHGALERFVVDSLVATSLRSGPVSQ